MSSTNSDMYLKPFEMLGVLARQRRKFSEPYLLKTGLNPTEARLLTLVAGQNGSISQDELSRLVYIDRTNVGRALKRLDQRGYVKRLKDENDKRANLVVATASAKKAVAELNKIRIQIARDFLGHLSQGEIDTLMDSMKRLVEPR